MSQPEIPDKFFRQISKERAESLVITFRTYRGEEKSLSLQEIYEKLRNEAFTRFVSKINSKEIKELFFDIIDNGFVAIKDHTCNNLIKRFTKTFNARVIDVAERVLERSV